MEMHGHDSQANNYQQLSKNDDIPFTRECETAHLKCVVCVCELLAAYTSTHNRNTSFLWTITIQILPQNGDPPWQTCNFQQPSSWLELFVPVHLWIIQSPGTPSLLTGWVKPIKLLQKTQLHGCFSMLNLIKIPMRCRVETVHCFEIETTNLIGCLTWKPPLSFV